MIDFKSKKWGAFVVVGVTGVVLLAPVILNMTLFQFTTPWTYGDGDEWLSFWGNYSGGLISAVVAYIVANFQIKKQQVINEHEKTIAQLPSLMRIRIELEKYLLELIRVNQERHAVVITKRVKADLNIQAEGAHLRKYTILLFKEENYNLLEKIENDDLHIKLISCFEFYDEFSESISLDVNSNKEDNFYQVQTISKKETAWRRLDDEDKLNFFKSVIEEVYEEIGTIQEKKKTK
jgi:hypothetical protein